MGHVVEIQIFYHFSMDSIMKEQLKTHSIAPAFVYFNKAHISSPMLQLINYLIKRNLCKQLINRNVNLK